MIAGLSKPMTDNAHRDSTDTVIDELRDWLSFNWDPDLTVAAWWERLGLAGWSAPTLPTNAYGRGLSRSDGVRVAQEIERFGALEAPARLGLLLAAPTIATHGTKEQIQTFVRDIVIGQKSWCQLFSEPAAGSDLAGVQTQAVRDGDEWIVNGQKVWTSGGQHANFGMLLARTNPELPKHQGLTYFALEMIQSGVEIRPLREMTGRAQFNEVFMTDARVANNALIGGENNGWAVANTTLSNERAGLGSGGGAGAAGSVLPGTVGGGLDLRAGDYSPVHRANARHRKSKSVSTEKQGAPDDTVMARALSDGAKLLVELSQSNGSAIDPKVRQGLAHLYTWSELGRFNALRLKAVKDNGGDIPGMPNISKLSMSHIMRLSRDLGLQICGAAGTLHAYNEKDRAALAVATSNPLMGFVTEIAMFAQAPSIYGGTDQVQRNIIGERVLGLPKEPNNDRTTPFSELPKNV
jgi:alkylation response protein AidB-like acyl-CoA dehydrogenase